MHRDSYAHLTSVVLRTGHYRIPHYEAWLWADAVAPGLDPHRSPLTLAYLVAMRSGAASIAELMTLLDTRPEDGVLFGELDIVLEKPVAEDVAYVVTARFTEVVRKSGKRIGTFDRAAFSHEIREETTGEIVAVVSQSWIVPRRSAA